MLVDANYTRDVIISVSLRTTAVDLCRAQTFAFRQRRPDAPSTYSNLTFERFQLHLASHRELVHIFQFGISSKMSNVLPWNWLRIT